jgi:hypothetical protein
MKRDECPALKSGGMLAEGWRPPSIYFQKLRIKCLSVYLTFVTNVICVKHFPLCYSFSKWVRLLWQTVFKINGCLNKNWHCGNMHA